MKWARTDGWNTGPPLVRYPSWLVGLAVSHFFESRETHIARLRDLKKAYIWGENRDFLVVFRTFWTNTNPIFSISCNFWHNGRIFTIFVFNCSFFGARNPFLRSKVAKSGGIPSHTRPISSIWAPDRAFWLFFCIYSSFEGLTHYFLMESDKFVAVEFNEDGQRGLGPQLWCETGPEWAF